jgi:hypothetical protein
LSAEGGASPQPSQITRTTLFPGMSEKLSVLGNQLSVFGSAQTENMELKTDN